MKDLRNPNMVASILQQAELALAKEAWQEVITLYEDTLFEGCITAEDAVCYRHLAKAYENLGEELYSSVLARQAQRIDGEAVDETALQSTTDYYELAYQSLLQLRWVEACIYYVAYEQSEGIQREKDEIRAVMMKEERLRHFYEQVKRGSVHYCLVVGKKEQETLVRALLFLKKKIYKIRTAHTAEELTVQIETLVERYCKREAWIILGERQQLQACVKDMRGYKVTQRLYVEPMPQSDSALSAFYMGNYFAIAKYMYGFDVLGQFELPASVKVSIVIPVKGYVDTLSGTLETCLRQDCQDFEVVVSDNGPPEDNRIADLIEEMGSSKIKYYRTPYELPLHKSFEYAYLRARGEFIFSIGADDGVLPYAVRYICENMISHPEEKVMLWERLFYVWPEFKTTGQAGVFTFPTQVKKNEHQLFFVEGKAMIGQILEGLSQGINGMYHMPMGYINSGMRRTHIQDMIERTGKFLDGSSQDVYTGIINLAMCDHVLYEKTPLTIAGMSGRSLGATTVLIHADLKKYKDYIRRYNQAERWTTLPSTPAQQKIFPQFDYVLWLYEFLKVCDLGLLTPVEEWLGKIDWAKIYEWLLNDLIKRPKEGIDTTGRIIECAYAQAEVLGDQVKAIVEQKHEAWELKLEDVAECVKQERQKSYQKGANGQQLTIDSEQFGIKGIAEASEFFVKLLDL